MLTHEHHLKAIRIFLFTNVCFVGDKLRDYVNKLNKHCFMFKINKLWTKLILNAITSNVIPICLIYFVCLTLI